MKNTNPILIISIMAMLSSCLSDSPKDLAVIYTSCDTTYAAKEIKPIIDKYCTQSGCHVSGAAQGDWNDFAAFKAHVNTGEVKDRINRQPGVLGFMPDDGDILLPEELKKLNDWINSGAPGCW